MVTNCYTFTCDDKRMTFEGYDKIRLVTVHSIPQTGGATKWPESSQIHEDMDGCTPNLLGMPLQANRGLPDIDCHIWQGEMGCAIN